MNNGYNIKTNNFEGPFDLLFHLIEKNKMNIYDISINEITNQYLDFLTNMKSLDLEIASEFVLMAATLIHIKSRLLLPKLEVSEETDLIDSKEALIIKLIEYKKHKEMSKILKEKESYWGNCIFKEPEEIKFTFDKHHLKLSSLLLRDAYLNILNKNYKKTNHVRDKMITILQVEKVSLKEKIREVIKALIDKTQITFGEIFLLKHKSKLEIVTGFLAILELAKLKKLILKQEKNNCEIILIRNDNFN